MKKGFFQMLLFLVCSPCFSQNQNILLEKDEQIWAGVINDGHLMPFQNNYQFNFWGDNKSNQVQPLILTNKGRYIWSEQPFSFDLQDRTLIIKDPFSSIQVGKAGNTLAEVQTFVSGKFFPASGKMPDSLLFSKPQYNTWIELTYNQNQTDILNYAQAILDHGFPAGVLMIDDTWQEDYGLWKFHPGRFPHPKEMIDKLHQMGFKVMVWICPFVSADQYQIYKPLSDKKAFMLEKINENDTWDNSELPAMVRWWNGVSAELDFSNPAAVKWFNDQLDSVVSRYGVDGFKFDAGDFGYYTGKLISHENISPNLHAELYARFGLRYPLNEFRACWKMAGQPLAQRLCDKGHSWPELQKLVPDMILEGLAGYTFSCPDMIGGGEFTSFLDKSTMDEDLVVRSAQCHALMPMMQFSVAPWRILDKEHYAAVKKAVDLRMKYTSYILELVNKSAKTGSPVILNLEYVFPNQGLAQVKDEFMLGNKILVAPMLEKGKSSRTVILPKGKWKADDGKILDGGKSYTIQVPLDRLPYFEIINK